MTRVITSESNSIFKLCKSLSKKKYRDRENKYIIEGKNLLEEAFLNKVNIECIIINSSVIDEKLDKTDYLTRFSNNFIQYDVVDNTYLMDSKLFDQISSTENSQGIIAIVGKTTIAIDTLEASIFDIDNVLILDRLQDPGNVGTIIRTADAAGYKCIICIKGTVDVYSPKVVRSAVGSIFKIPIVYFNNEQEVIDFVNKIEFDLVATSPYALKSYYEVNLACSIALIIGNEANGVSDYLLTSAKQKIKLPMNGNIDSLNAAVSAAILMYERIRNESQ